MRKTGLGILLLLSLSLVCTLVCAQDEPSRNMKLNRAEVSRFLGRWEGTIEWKGKVPAVSRTIRIDVKAGTQGGYRATVFQGPHKPNVGLLRTSPPSERERKAKFKKINNVPCMTIKIGRRPFQFFLRNGTLYGECEGQSERSCTLTRSN
jgi:hypothetical protein